MLSCTMKMFQLFERKVKSEGKTAVWFSCFYLKVNLLRSLKKGWIKKIVAFWEKSFDLIYSNWVKRLTLLLTELSPEKRHFNFFALLNFLKVWYDTKKKKKFLFLNKKLNIFLPFRKGLSLGTFAFGRHFFEEHPSSF